MTTLHVSHIEDGEKILSVPVVAVSNTRARKKAMRRLNISGFVEENNLEFIGVSGGLVRKNVLFQFKNDE